MTASLLRSPNILPETAAGSGDSSLSNGKEADACRNLVRYTVKQGEEEDDNDIMIDEDVENKAQSSSAHTDDEEYHDEKTKDTKVHFQSDNNNTVDNTNDKNQGKEKTRNEAEASDTKTSPRPHTSILKVTSAPPHKIRSPRWNDRESRVEKEASSDNSDSDDNQNIRESYTSYKIGRKNLLKIERLTDSYEHPCVINYHIFNYSFLK